MTISEQIRAAALGPRPQHDSVWLYSWFGMANGAHKAVLNLSDFFPASEVTTFTDATETERRMFLLLCAEALESETA